MSVPSTAHFFSELPIHKDSLSDLFGDESRFVDVPDDWYAVVTDLKNSTKAFGEGRYEEINLIAAGCIIAALNIARRNDVNVPFFFGGDGATLLVPNTLLAPVVQALAVHRERSRDQFGLELRVGFVPVAGLRSAGHDLKISRLYTSDFFSIPILLGRGLSEAERIVKTNDGSFGEHPVSPNVLDLNGMECRWDRVEPANASHEVVCLVVTARDGRHQAPVFKQVMELIEAIYGSRESRNPVSLSRLALTAAKISLEMRTRLGGFDLWYFLRNWFITQYGRLFYTRSEGGRYYMGKLVELTDTLVIDGGIHTVIAGSVNQRQYLERELAKMERDGLITFGLFVSRESVMSCYVSDREDKHIHFVDGSDGGYTMAATMWKQKLRRA